MNPVAKEFVSARDDEKGVLLLSEFTGAAHELGDALSINPHASEDCARTLAEALTMPVGEQASRMRSMRTVVGHANAFRWAANILADAIAVHAAKHGRSEFGRSAATNRAVASI